MLLAVCMMLTMNSGFAFAAEEPLPAEASITETTESTESPEASGEATAADDEQEELSDPMGSDTEGETPSVDAPVCTCNPAPGTSSVEGHGEDCPLYEEPEPPADEQGECTCPPVDSGEMVHGEDCPLYVAPQPPAVPEQKCICTALCTAEAVNAECPICAGGFESCAYTAAMPTETMTAVYALIDALPTMAELEAVDPEGEEFPAYLEKLQADAEAARAAYDALTPEERDAFDPARLEKLKAIEGLFAISLMAAEIPTLGADNSYQNVVYTLTTGSPNTATISGVVDKTAVTGDNNALTIPTQVQTSDSTTYNVTAIAGNAFSACSLLEAVTVPGSVTAIGNNAFLNIKPGAAVTLKHDILPEGIVQKSFGPMENGMQLLYVVIQDETVASALVAKYTDNNMNCFGIIVKEKPANPSFNVMNTHGTIGMANPTTKVALGRYDVIGKNANTDVLTTFLGKGYEAYISTDSTPERTNSKLLRLAGEGVEGCAGDGIWAKVDADFVSGGNYLRVTYTLRNATATVKSDVSLGVAADVQIGNDDFASIYSTATGFRLVNTKLAADDPAGSGMQFTLNCTNAPGADDVSTMWYGASNYTWENLFNNLADKGNLIGTDSALTFSWKNMSIPAGESITRSVVFGVGEAAEPPELPAEKPFGLKVSADFADLKVTAKVTDTAGLTDTLYYTVNGGSEGTLGNVIADGNEKEIEGTIPVSSLSNGDNTVSVWVMNSKGAMSETVTFKVTVSGGKIDKVDDAPPEVDYIATTGVSLDKTTATLRIPATEQLTATVAPTNATDKTVTWSSNALGVATVSASGLVTSVSAGTATITATAKDGQTTTCDVTVIAPVTITTATPTHATTYGGTGSIVITADGGQGTFEYSKNNTDWQDSETFAGLAAGVYTVYARDKADTTNVSAGTAVTVKQPAATPTVRAGDNQAFAHGEFVDISVTAECADGGALTYQWYKGTSANDNTPAEAKKVSTTTGTGTTANFKQATGDSRLTVGTYYYFCEVTNTTPDTTETKSAVSPVITVTVTKADAPTFTLSAGNLTPTYGDTITLTATIGYTAQRPTGRVTFKSGTDEISFSELTTTGVVTYDYTVTSMTPGAFTASYAGDGNYNAMDSNNVTLTVGKKPLNITVTAPANLTYDGNPKAATLTGVTGLTEGTDYTLTYDPANPKDVGDYTATFALTTEGEAKYTASGTLSVSFAITQAAGVGTVTCADIMFGGTVAPVPVSDTNGINNVTYLYKVKNADDSTYTATVPADVGNYTVKATFAETTNYTEATDTADFGITPAAVTGITVTPYTGVYDGVAHNAVTVIGTLPDDTVTYSTNGGSNYFDKMPTVQDQANGKEVMVKVERVNHIASVTTVSAKVEKKEVAVTFTVPTDLVYDGNDKTVTAEITNKCGTDDVSLTLGNATGKAKGNYTTTADALTGTDAGNYKLPASVPSVEWEITGTPYPHEIILPTASGITYGHKLSDSALTGGDAKGTFAWNDGTIVPSAGTYAGTVAFTPTDINFASVTRTVDVAVAKKDVTVAVSDGTKVYGAEPIAQDAFTVTPTGMVNGETDNALLGTLALTSAGNIKTAAVGSYDITIAQSGTSNYTVTTETIAGGFTVTRAAQMLTGTASYQKLLTDKDFALDVKTDSTDTDAAVTYTLTNDGGGAVMLDADGKTVHMKKSGTATITANGLQTANFEAADPLTITVTIGSMPSVRALATEGITTTDAKIGGVVTVGTIDTTGYGLEYKKASDADYTPVSPSETDNGSAKTLTHSLVGLEKDTEYTVRVWAKTADKTFESGTRFRTAAEQPPTGKVEGAITDNSGTNTAITVTIEAGNTVIASHTVKAGGGTFTFEALPDGFYNLVADNGKYKVTRMVEIVKGGAVTNVQMEIGRTQSVVEIVTPDTPNVAVDGLPELFGNETLYTQADQDLVTNHGGTVEFKLTVEKKDSPTDAEEIDKIAEGKVGVYLDIGLRKTVIDQNGREQESELVPDLGANEITIVIPLTRELQGKQSYTVYRVHNGTAEKLDSTHNADGNTLTIQSSLFSTYAIAYTEKSGGTGGGSDGSSHDEDNYDFWQKVKDKINSSDDGDTVKAGAGSYDKMPESVMDALRKNPGVTLEITWNGGDKITIPAGGALEKDGLRIYYPLAYLAELFAKGSTPAPEKNHINPETGGVWEVNAPVTAVQTPAIPTPKNEGTAATPEQAQVERAAIEPPTAPEIATIPDVAEVADSAPSRNRAVLFTGIAFMLAAAAVACGVILWKKKNEEEQTNEK